MRLRGRSTLLLAALALGAGTGAASQEQPGAQKSPTVQAEQSGGKTRRTVIHFGEDAIRGDLTRPDGELVQAPRRVEQQSLLRTRKTFIDRALQGAARGQ